MQGKILTVFVQVLLFGNMSHFSFIWSSRIFIYACVVHGEGTWHKVSALTL